jgi:hypothetical protein
LRRRGDNAAEQATTLVGTVPGIRQGLWPAALAHQLQDLDRVVIVVQHAPLRRLTGQLVKGRREGRRDRSHNRPLPRACSSSLRRHSSR